MPTFPPNPQRVLLGDIFCLVYTRRMLAFLDFCSGKCELTFISSSRRHCCVLWSESGFILCVAGPLHVCTVCSGRPGYDTVRRPVGPRPGGWCLPLCVQTRGKFTWRGFLLCPFFFCRRHRTLAMWFFLCSTWRGRPCIWRPGGATRSSWPSGGARCLPLRNCSSHRDHCTR